MPRLEYQNRISPEQARREANAKNLARGGASRGLSDFVDEAPLLALQKAMAMAEQLKRVDTAMLNADDKHGIPLYYGLTRSVPGAAMDALESYDRHLVRPIVGAYDKTLGRVAEALPDLVGEALPGDDGFSTAMRVASALPAAAGSGIVEYYADPFSVAAKGLKYGPKAARLAAKYAPEAARLAKTGAVKGLEAIADLPVFKSVDEMTPEELFAQAGGIFPKRPSRGDSIARRAQGAKRAEEIARLSKVGAQSGEKVDPGIYPASHEKSTAPDWRKKTSELFAQMIKQRADMRTSMQSSLAKSGIDDSRLADDYLDAIADPLGSAKLSQLMTSGRFKPKGKGGRPTGAVRSDAIRASSLAGLRGTRGAFLKGSENFQAVPLGSENGVAQFGGSYLVPEGVKTKLADMMANKFNLAKSPLLRDKLVEAAAKAVHMKKWYSQREQLEEIGRAMGQPPGWGSDPSRLRLSFPEDIELMSRHARLTALREAGSTNSGFIDEVARASGANEVFNDLKAIGISEVDAKELAGLLKAHGSKTKAEYAIRAGAKPTGGGFGLDASAANNLKAIAGGRFTPLMELGSGDPNKVFAYVTNHFGNRGLVTVDRHMNDIAMGSLYAHAKDVGDTEMLELLQEVNSSSGTKHAFGDMLMKQLRDYIIENPSKLPPELREALADGGLSLDDIQAIMWGAKNDLVESKFLRNPSLWTEIKNNPTTGEKYTVTHPQDELMGPVETYTGMGEGGSAFDLLLHQVGRVYNLDPYSREARDIAGRVASGQITLPPPLKGI